MWGKSVRVCILCAICMGETKMKGGEGIWWSHELAAQIQHFREGIRNTCCNSSSTWVNEADKLSLLRILGSKHVFLDFPTIA